MTKERFKWYMKQIKRLRKLSKKSTDGVEARYIAEQSKKKGLNLNE